MSVDQQVRNFYSELQFPGPYSIDDLRFHCPEPKNPFLKIIHDNIGTNTSVLDIGCGTGLIGNLMAMNNPSADFLGLDFSDAVDYAQHFAKHNEISNIRFVKQDILNFQNTNSYDVVLCQGVLHHIPQFELAVEKINCLLKPNGVLILGVYHPTGKILKKYVKLKYVNHILTQDQEAVPFELSFTQQQVQELFQDFSLVQQYPRNSVTNFVLHPLQHSYNGGLTTYILKKQAIRFR